MFGRHPVVAGITALLLSEDPTLTHDDVQRILENTAEDLVGASFEDTPGRDNYFGYGRVNMNDALTAAIPDSVGSFVSFAALPATFTTIPDPTGCPGVVGRFRFDAQLANISTTTLSNLSARVTSLSGGNLVLLPKGRTGGAGARLVLARTDGLSDGSLAPGEQVRVPFEICLRQFAPFELFVNVNGMSAASAEDQ